MNIMLKVIFSFLVAMTALSTLAQPLLSGVKKNEADYYFVQPDVRRCAAPRCGGVFVQKVNSRSMRCPNGERALQCYVHYFDAQALSVSPFKAAVKSTSFIVSGVITIDMSGGELGSSANVATFKAAQVFSRVGKASDVGKFWSIQSHLSRCITEPCFYGEAELVNGRFKRSFSDYDLSKAGLSDMQVAKVKSYLKKGEPVLTKAIRRSYKGSAGRGVRFVSTEVYLPLNAPK